MYVRTMRMLIAAITKFVRRVLWNSVLASLSIVIYFLHFKGLHVDELMPFFTADPEWFEVHLIFVGLLSLMISFDYFLDHYVWSRWR